MILFPAIDLKDGLCVRLREGDMAEATVFNQSPSQQARIFQDQGFNWIHLVDLNGAFEGEPVNVSAVESIIEAVDVKLQLGGGIRSMQRIEYWLEKGIDRVILGTVALKNPDLVKQACLEHPRKIVVGIDAKDGRVAVEGWAETSDIDVLTLAIKFEDAGVEALIYTDIGRDGLMKGPDIEGTKSLAEAISIPVILSGGISSNADIYSVKTLEETGVTGIIAGRAIYEKKIDINEALKVLKSDRVNA